MAKKEKTKYYPKDFPNVNFVKKFKKPRSPRTRILSCMDPEEWWVDVLEIKTKTGEVVYDPGWITMKEVDKWTKRYEGLGWEEIKDDE